MFNNVEHWFKQLNKTLEQAKRIYEEFRLYSLGSYALNCLTPRQGYTVQSNIAYGLRARHRLDLYRTTTPRPQRPLMVFVHGGAWSRGDKQDYRFVGEAFAKEGFDVAVMNYQLAPQHIFPTYIDDLTLALNYLTQQQHKLGISTAQVVLMGHSAGAFNVMSLLYHPQPYALSCKDHIRAIIGLAGPYHFDYKDDPLCADAFDQEVPYQDVMPYYFVEPNSVKHYLLVAEKDQIVGASNATDFDHVLKKYGNHSEIIVIPKTGHVSVMASVSSLFSRFFATKRQIMRALDQALKDA
ncbi:alpha/beta hydrolase [Acinetobacter towneri]|uniref:alpha/beta hydrolase n=1 Tax=Acinetobacter towneri TaxID=202956 RepID=UPI001CE1C1F6|nr:alpha/beta hydrolase [Acinetobacter towneri]MCA4778986.1 alpha/beta hydrolase [Acinetobacter towneri]MCA4784314.1 alpha/beta hydrolase [Acinetobacter towneri]MCA4786775.1 alpha/beta hydrolase [Acinetobacter towneri]MCA4795533.1 alpha/beta hydrolase [Acinetobacter towneri]MCA4800546.1 alpha/beta hydrolase [Acinetobacter towneri]